MARQHVERALLALAVDETCNDVGIERGSAGGHSAHRLDEHADVAHLFLEQISDTLSAVDDQVERVTILEELREDEHANRPILDPDRQRSAKPVVGPIGRHLDIGHDHVRVIGARLGQQFARIARGGHDLEAGLGEYVHDPLSQDRLVLSHDHPDRRGHARQLCQ